MLDHTGVEVLPSFLIGENGGLFQEFAEYRTDPGPTHELVCREGFYEITVGKLGLEVAVVKFTG